MPTSNLDNFIIIHIYLNNHKSDYYSHAKVISFVTIKYFLEYSTYNTSILIHKSISNLYSS
jgi:hypothetical protein